MTTDANLRKAAWFLMVPAVCVFACSIGTAVTMYLSPSESDVIYQPTRPSGSLPSRGLPVHETAAERAKARTPLQEVNEQFTAKILSLTEKNNYQAAIRAAAKYEQELLWRYAPARHEMGLVQSEAEHISMHSHFDGWKPLSASELGIPKGLTMAGFSVVVAQRGDSDEERFTCFALNMGRLADRLSGGAPGELFKSDKALLMIGRILARNLGTVRSHRFRKLGDHRVLYLDVAGPQFGPEIRIVILRHDGTMFAYMLMSPAGDIEKNEELLVDTIKTTSFDYKPPDKAAIARIRKGCTRTAWSILECVGALGDIGEYGATARELTALRRLLFSRLPSPTVSGDTASCPAFGISLTNPDTSRWKLGVLQEGPMQMILLTDRHSVSEEGIAVAAIDLVMMYGPEFADLITQEGAKKEFLLSGGRSGASFLGQIQTERFVLVKGWLAYEAVVLPDLPRMRARVQFIIMDGHALVLCVMGNPSEWESRLAECDRIISSDFLKLTADATEKQPDNTRIVSP